MIDSPVDRKPRSTQSLGNVIKNTSPANRRSLTTGRKPEGHEESIDVCDTINPNKKKVCTKTKDECPCSQSLGDYWLILCSNKQCNQRWHTNCCNLPGPCTEDEVNNLTDNGWLCPWCYSSPYPQPKNHPVKKQDASLLSAANISTLCESVKETLVAHIIPAITPDSSSRTENLTAELNNLSQSIKADLNNLKEEIERFSKESCSEDPSVRGSHENQLHKEPSIPISPSEEPPYTSITENLLNDELLKSLDTFVHSVSGKFIETAKNRKTLYFGDYSYKYGETKHNAAPPPDAIKSLIAAVKEKFPNEDYNSCLISQYDKGTDFCPSHKDDEPWINPTSNICTVSIGCERVMRFSRPNNADNDREIDSVDLNLPHNSMLLFSRKSQESWKHSIIPDKDITSPRWSFTLRQIKPHYINSTLIIGDSNTQELKFGESKGCFGAWVPGERIKAGRIADIPDPEKLNPYRNLLLHVGINDINRHNRESTRELISNLDAKCKNISQAFPNMKIYISLLLPTTNQELNSMINEFNQKLHLLVNSRSYLNNAIQHHYLLDDDRKLKNAFCRDYLHLNSTGICEFVRIIKKTIIHRRPGTHHAQETQLPLQSRVPGFPPRRLSTTSPPWTNPPPPVTPGPGVGWTPSGMRSFPPWLPPIHPCPPWFPQPPPHLGPGASDFNSFNSGCDAYKVRHNIQRVNHRQ